VSLAESDDHLCHCGRWGAFGYGRFMRQGEMGTWYCGKHRPQGPVPVNEVIVALTADQIAWVDDKSYKRTVERWEQGARPQGGQPVDFDTWVAENKMGARGEAAVRVWSGKTIRWRFLEPLNKTDANGVRERMPDFGDFIDVKTVNYSRAQLWLTPAAPPEWAFLLVSCNLHPQYRIIGWCYGRDAMVDQYWNESAPRDPAWVVNQGDLLLRAPHELLQLAQEP
jgi:hypothetical protein